MPATVFNWDEHRSTTVQRLQGLADFFTAIRVSLDAHEHKVKTELDQAFAQKEPDDPSGDEDVDTAFQVLSHYSSHFNNYYHHIPRYLHYSCIIQLYTLFEERGRALCNELKKRDESIPLKVTDLSDKGDFDSIQLFITKLCGVNYRYWGDLHLLRRIRNRLVHHNGYLPETAKPEKTEKQIIKAEGVRIDSDRFILICPEYVDFCLSRITNFFNTVFEARGFGDTVYYTSSGTFDHGAILMDTSNKKTKVTLTSELTPRD